MWLRRPRRSSRKHRCPHRTHFAHGASERRSVGASERRSVGASERRSVGASHLNRGVWQKSSLEPPVERAAPRAFRSRPNLEARKSGNRLRPSWLRGFRMQNTTTPKPPPERRKPLPESRIPPPEFSKLPPECGRLPPENRGLAEDCRKLPPVLGNLSPVFGKLAAECGILAAEN